MEFSPVVPASDGFLYASEMFEGEGDWEDAQNRIYARLRQSHVDPGLGRWKQEAIERDGTLWCHVLSWTTRPHGYEETPAK